MARPVNADAAATRGRILKRAADLFAHKGEGNTSMRDIGRAASVSLATVHHYFGSKEDLYRAAVDSMYQELEALRDELVRAWVPSRPVEEVIDEVVRSTFRFVCEHRPAVKLVMRTVIDTGEVPEERRDGVLVPFLGQGAELLSGPLGMPREQVRLVLLSMNHLISRYALSSPEELVVVVGGDVGEAEAVARVEDHLVQVALVLCGLRSSRSRLVVGHA